MAEIDYYEVFGVEKPDEGESENNQEVAETDNENADKGVNEQEVAEPAVDGEDDTEGEQEAEVEEDKNATFAKMRRDAEAKAMSKIDKEIAAMGLRDSKGNEITTYEAFKALKQEETAAQKSEEEAELRDRLLDSGFSESDTDAIIEGQKARSRMAELEKRMADIENERRQEAFNAKVRDEIAIINEFDPSINSIEDLSKMDNFDEFVKRVEAGESYLSAYMLTHRGVARTSRATSSNNNKAHLSATKTRGNGGVDVPQSVIDSYRVFNPKATREEIIKHYRKNHKGE